jgi:chemotaxis protein methyltransferase CheR
LRPLAIQADKQKLIPLLAEKQYDQAFPLAEALLVASPQDYQTRLLKAFILMNRKQWEAAEALLMQTLQQDDWCLDALVLLGLLAKWQGRIEQAIEWFKKAVYAHSDRWLVHYYLADSYYRQQQSPLALRGFKTALQLMDKHPELSDLRWVPLDFSMAEMRFLCQHHIQKLTAQGKDASHGN